MGNGSALMGCLVLLGALAAGGCRRDPLPENATPLFTPFNQRKPVATLEWTARAGVASVVARSRMEGRLALQVERIRLHDADGGDLATIEDVRCQLQGGGRAVLLEVPLGGDGGEVRLAATALGIPIDDPGRSIYREWAWLRRPHEIDEIDREIAERAALPACADVRSGLAPVAAQ